MNHSDLEERNIDLVKRLFDSARRLDAEAVDELFTPEFVMISNDVEWDFQQFKDYHVESYKTRKAIEVSYGDLFCKENKVSARVTITLSDQDGGKKEFQVILIAHVLNDRIHRLWEVTFPHWQ